MIFFLFLSSTHSDITVCVKAQQNQLVFSFFSSFPVLFWKATLLLFQVTCSSLMCHLPLVFLVPDCFHLLPHEFIGLPSSCPAPQPFVLVQAAEKLKVIIIYRKFSHMFCWDSILKGVFLLLILNLIVLPSGEFSFHSLVFLSPTPLPSGVIYFIYGLKSCADFVKLAFTVELSVSEPYSESQPDNGNFSYSIFCWRGVAGLLTAAHLW